MNGASFLPWINRALEALWLIAVVLIPLAFLDQTYAISEAQIAYVEVPKVALLRTLAGVMALLWIAEWSIQGTAFQRSLTSLSINEVTGNLNPARLAQSLKDWLRVHPTRWLGLAAFAFFGSTLISTILSGSFSVSMWGEIPGQDGYSAYSVLSQGVIFGVVATHLRGEKQLARLVGAVVLMGFLVGLYGVLQHSGHDFLNTTEATGGSGTRVTIFMGNTIFAGAVLAMSVPFTLVVATLSFRNVAWGDWGPFSKLGQLGKWSPITPGHVSKPESGNNESKWNGHGEHRSSENRVTHEDADPICSPS